MVRRTPPPEIGHNALVGAAYTAIYLCFAVEIVTGFALYSRGFEGGFVAWTLGWPLTVFSAPTLRLVHGVVMWVILAFVIHHAYSAILIDTEEHSGMVASIFTGNKTFTEEHLAAAAGESPDD